MAAVIIRPWLMTGFINGPSMKYLRPQFIIAQLLLLMAVAPLLATEVEGLRLWRAPDHTRLVLDLSAAV